MNSDLQKIPDYSEKIALALNPSKSKVLTFGVENSEEISVMLRGERVEICDEAKNLGVYIDSGLRFGGHVSACLRSAYGTMRMLYPHRHMLDVGTKKMLCDSLVLSRFNHADSVYGPCLLEADVYRVQRVQNSCLRFIYGIRKFERVTHTLITAKWLNMRQRRLLHFLCLCHRVVVDKVPQYLYQKIQFRTDVHHLNIRHKGNITIPAHRTTTFERSFSYNVAKLYNGCPAELKSMSHVTFKRNIKDLIKNNHSLASV